MKTELKQIKADNEAGFVLADEEAAAAWAAKPSGKKAAAAEPDADEPEAAPAPAAKKGKK